MAARAPRVPFPIVGTGTGGAFTGFYLRDGRLVAALFANRRHDVESSRVLIQRRMRATDAVRPRLADPQGELGAIAADAAL